MKPKIDYDPEQDILYLSISDKSVDFSIDYDDTVLDVSGNIITGVEIMNASEKFGKSEKDMVRMKKALSSIKESIMKVDYGANSITVKIGFVSLIPERTSEGLVIQVPIKKSLMLKA